MPFTRPTFLGASVKSYTTNLGLNEQPSELIVSLVEDPANGDAFNYTVIGTPVYFNHNALNFRGITQKWVMRNNPQGLPTYEVTVHDPRVILEKTHVIIRDYNGTTQGVRNLLNAYGYVENLTGFGSASINDGGMPWYLIKSAVQNLTALSSYGTYGGPLTSHGWGYNVDLSYLPIPPSAYRIQSSDSLLTMISQVCEDGGCDFYVDLSGTTIIPKVISRVAQPPLGTITTLSNQWYGSGTTSSFAGLEARHDITSSFLLGGPLTDMFYASGGLFQQYWGLDNNGNVIIGSGLNGAEGAYVNANSVAAILGSLTYNLTKMEIRCALDSMDMWASFIEHHRPDVVNALGFITAPFKNVSGTGANTTYDLVNDSSGYADTISRYIVTGEPIIRQTRMYEFVKGFAEQYYGKKMLVRIPNAEIAEEADTFRQIYSHEPTDSAWVEGGYPLALHPFNYDKFQTNDGRFPCMVLFDSSGNDVSKFSEDDATLQGSGLYVKADLDNKLYFTDAGGGNLHTHVLLTLRNALYQKAPDFVGNIADMAFVLQGTPAGISGAFQDLVGGACPLHITPIPVFPLSGAIPLISNTTTYGPWYIAGPSGRVKFEQDTSLVPWNYGGYTGMQTAAYARVTNALTNMVSSEAGEIEVVEAPIVSLGEALVLNGPQCSNINVSVGEDGVKTKYVFRTYTPKFGLFSRGNADRIKRMAQTNVALRRADLQNTKNTIALNNTRVAAQIGSAFNTFIDNVVKAAKKESPHNILCASLMPPTSSSGIIESSGSLVYRAVGSSMTYPEAVIAANASNSTRYLRTGIMSFEGLVRPFSTNILSSGMPKFATPAITGASVTSSTYNPFQAGNDIEIMAFGNTYQGLHAFRHSPSASNLRPIALRGPIVICGWGRGIDGQSYWPGNANSSGGFNTGYASNYLKKCPDWPVGPLDLHWDNYRGVWSSRDLLFGTIGPGAITSTASGLLTVTSGMIIPVYNWFSSAISVSSTTKATAGWSAQHNKYFIIAMDC